MARIESTLVVQRSLEDVFDFLNLPESHRKFIPRCIEFRQMTDGSFGQVRTKIKGILNYFGIRIPVDYEIIEHQTNRSLIMKGLMGPVTFKDGYILNSNGNGTIIKFWLELNPTGWTKIFYPFAGLIGKFHAWETLRNLKREIALSG